MKSNEVADESYSINGFKHFSDLAVAYFPQMASTSSAPHYTVGQSTARSRKQKHG